MSDIYYLTEDDIHGIVESLTQDLFPNTPAFQLAGREGAGRLDAALAQPQWHYHETVHMKAAALHYSLNKDHPFVDGNKRLAVTAMEWFMVRNGFFLLTTNKHLLDFALDIAKGHLSRDDSATWIEGRAMSATWDQKDIELWLGQLPGEEFTEVVNSAQDSGSAPATLVAAVRKFGKATGDR